MDPSAVNANLTIDDFDSIITYANQSEWVTPDPSAANFVPLSWVAGTFHRTDVPGASFTFNFIGAALYIYGRKGSEYGAFSIQWNGVDVANVTTYSEVQDASETPILLWSSDTLEYSQYNVTITNLGAADTPGNGLFLLDYMKASFQLAPAGATVTNTTLEETDPAIKYNGTWDNNSSPVFSGGGTTYTNEDGASFELDFEASAIYVLGDKKNDHRTYSVYLDDADTPVTLNGISGCGGEFGMTCEQQIPTIKYFASNLAAGQHHLRLVNNAENDSYFDLDSIVLSVPSEYAPRELSSASSSPSESGSPSGPSSSSDPSPTNGAVSTLGQIGINQLLLFFLGIHLFFSIVRRRC